MTERKGKSGTIDVKALLAGDEEFLRALERTALQEVLEVVNRRPKGSPDRHAKRTPRGNCHGRRGRTAGGRGAPGVAQRPTDVRCTGA